MDYTLEELLPIVQTLTEKHTGGDSTSVTYELANQFMEAILYCLNETAASGKNGALRAETPDARLAYETGHQLVHEKTVAARKLYEEMLPDFDAYGNQAYYDTIVKGMPAFFMNYDTRFAPQNHLLTLDYPVLGTDPALCGIDAIWAYLNAIRKEQAFLGKFPKEHIHNVLSSHHRSYTDLIINLCSQMLQHTLICLLLKKPLSTVLLDAGDFEALADLIASCTPDQLESQLIQLSELLIQSVYDNDRELLFYLQKDSPDFCTRLMQFSSLYPECSRFCF